MAGGDKGGEIDGKTDRRNHQAVTMNGNVVNDPGGDGATLQRHSLANSPLTRGHHTYRCSWNRWRTSLFSSSIASASTSLILAMNSMAPGECVRSFLRNETVLVTHPGGAEIENHEITRLQFRSNTAGCYREECIATQGNISRRRERVDGDGRAKISGYPRRYALLHGPGKGLWPVQAA